MLFLWTRTSGRFAEKYAADEKAFFSDYVKAHLKLSELGVEWETAPITLD